MNNADLLSQMISNNEIRKITAQKQLESKQLAEKIQSDLDDLLRYENEPSPLPAELTDDRVSSRMAS